MNSSTLGVATKKFHLFFCVLERLLELIFVSLLSKMESKKACWRCLSNIKV